jgi:hypothetical protein
MTELTITEPTILYDLDENEYHSQRSSLSASGAKWLAPPSPCPAKFRWAMDNPRTSDAFDLGHVAHRLVLGKGNEFEVLLDEDGEPYRDRRTKACQALDASIRDSGKVPILAADHDQAMAMALAVKTDPLAGPLFTDGDAEVSMFWPDAETGVVRRARLDWLRKPQKGKRLLIGDLKTARSADPYVFGKSAADFGYAISAANYVDGAIACGLDTDPAFLFAIVEKAEPYVVTVLQAPDDVIDLGRALMRSALRLFAQCSAADDWPGYLQTIGDLELPGYFTHRIEEMIA